MTVSPLVIAQRTFTSRLFLGTGKFGTLQEMTHAIKESGTELVTVALRRISAQDKSQFSLLEAVKETGVSLLPNTSGVRTAKEAIFAAELAREALQTEWLKLEVHPDPYHLLPDPIETFKATEQLAKKGFKVLPYIPADPVLCKRLEEVGAVAVMPLGAPIGTNQGLTTKKMLELIIERTQVPVIVDAGIGKPSEAMQAMEMGVSAVLINTAIAVAHNPPLMAKAFKGAVENGVKAYEAGLGEKRSTAEASSPLTDFIDNLS